MCAYKHLQDQCLNINTKDTRTQFNFLATDF